MNDHLTIYLHVIISNRNILSNEIQCDNFTFHLEELLSSRKRKHKDPLVIQPSIAHLRYIWYVFLFTSRIDYFNNNGVCVCVCVRARARACVCSLITHYRRHIKAEILSQF